MLTGGPHFAASVSGPDMPNGAPTSTALTIEQKGDGAIVCLHGSTDVPLQLRTWSPWVQLTLRGGLLTRVAGQVRFLLLSAAPHLELFMSAVHYAPAAPPFPISTPWHLARDLERSLGSYGTLGMIEEHKALDNDRISEADFLVQCDDTWREREAMLFNEIDRADARFVFTLFDTPDRVQHMFWRYRDVGHASNAHYTRDVEHQHAITTQYERCDQILGRVLSRSGPDDLVIAVSDHGFTNFRRGMNLNRWLLDNGWLVLKRPVEFGTESDSLLREVDWSRTRAYALGLGSVYVNQCDREREGCVDPDDAPRVAKDLARQLTGAIDVEAQAVAVEAVAVSREIYSGERVNFAPDLTVGFAEGYRASWATGLGGIGQTVFEENERRWSGDHIVNPQRVPGVMACSQSVRLADPNLADFAPTILAALGAPPAAEHQGRSML